MIRTKTWFILLSILLVFGCVGAFAQANSALTGIVTDPTGAVVAGAQITLTDPATGSVKSTETGPTGLYVFSGLNPAKYDLKVTTKGFQTFSQTGIQVNVSATFREDVKLTVGAESQTVTVEADALQVQTDSNVVSTLISSQQISEIATENRNFAALAALGLGVSSALPDSNTPTSVAANFTISVNGLRQSHNIWLIDGGEADDRGGAGGMDIMPSQDAIAEFQMMTSNYPPDYGISSGATMSLSLKSGTQKFHGEAFEFNRNTAYDANSFFNKQGGGKRQTLNYNIYGFNIGGPLYIPKVYNTSKQKTFFFWNEEWRKINQPSGANKVNTLPTADIPKSATAPFTYVVPKFANTDLTQGPVGGIVVPRADMVKDPAYQAKLTGLGLTPGSPFPGNTIPAALINANAVLYLNQGIFPTPSSTLNNDQAISSAQTPITVRDDVLRVDQKINDKWQVLGHYMHDSVSQAYGQPFLGWLWASYNTVTSQLANPANSAAVKMTGQISSNMVIESSINYDGNVINITNNSKSVKPTGWSVNPFFNNGNKSLPGITGFGNPYGTAEDMGSAPWHNAAQDYEPKVDVSYTMGKHAMKFGFSYNRYTKNQQLFGQSEGNFGFGGNSSGQYTGNKIVSACQTNPVPASCVIGDGVVDMILGLAGNYNQVQATPIRHYVNQTPSVYAMDNWHVTPRLTLQLGLRYDALPHAWERQNLVSNFNPATFLSSSTPKWDADGSQDPTGPGYQTFTVGGVAAPYYVNGVNLAGKAGFPAGLVTNDYRTLQPRVGFSEDIFGNGRTVLRGGIGTFYERMQGNDIYNAATTVPFYQNPGASQVYFTNPSTSNITGLTAATPHFAGGLTNLQQNYRAPAVAQFSLGIQHEVVPSMILVVQYVGNLAWHQNINRNINTYPLDTPLAVRKAGGNVTTADGTPTGAPLPVSGQGHIANVSDSWRTYNGFGGITQQENTTNGSYNGFQTGLRVQNKWGLSGEIDYTFSHEIDITSYDLNGVSNPWNLRYDKGSGALDRRHIVSANYMYKLPFFTKSSGLVKSILGGWELAGTFVDESGVPVANSLGGNDTIGLGGGYTNRMNVSAKMTYPKKINQWFDTSKFSRPVAAWNGGQNQGFGNAGKDAIVGPGRVNFTTSLYKSFAITEAAHFELRAETFNTFNHTQFNSINVNGPIGDNSNFGQVTNTWDPRVMELGGKFVF